MPPVALAGAIGRAGASLVIRPVAASASAASASSSFVPLVNARPFVPAAPSAAQEDVCRLNSTKALAVTQELAQPFWEEPSHVGELEVYAPGTEVDQPSTSGMSFPEFWDLISQAATHMTFECPKDHNSVTIKSDTSVKDAAGAIVKVLNRLSSTFVTALRLEPSHEALNRAVKALAVARKYVIDTDGVSDEEASTSGRVELSFQPLNRTNDQGAVDPNLFAFLAYKSRVAPGVSLLEHDETDLNVSQGSDPNAMANAIIRIVKERGQAVMKAGGGNALFVAMTAVVNARRRLKKGHGIDVMLVPQWITEDTRERLGRESKFLRFNILPCAIPGREVQEGTAAIAPLPPPPEPLPSCAASVVSMA